MFFRLARWRSPSTPTRPPIDYEPVGGRVGLLGDPQGSLNKSRVGLLGDPQGSLNKEPRRLAAVPWNA